MIIWILCINFSSFQDVIDQGATWVNPEYIEYIEIRDRLPSGSPEEICTQQGDTPLIMWSFVTKSDLVQVGSIPITALARCCKLYATPLNW
jgi:hypothetical protein